MSVNRRAGDRNVHRLPVVHFLDDSVQPLLRSGEAGIQRRDRVQLFIDSAQFLVLGSFGVMGDHGDSRGQQRAHRQYGSDVTQLESQSDHRR